MNRKRVLNRRRVSSSRNDDFIPKRLSYPESINLSNRKPVTVTNPIVLHRHLAARMRMVAPFLNNTLFSRCSISTRALAAGWLGAWLAGWLAGWGTKMRQKRVLFARKCVENVTLRQKVDVEALQLLGTKCTCPPAAFLSNKRYSRCLISTRAWAAGWLGAWLVGWGTKMRLKRVPLARKCVRNAYP